MAEILRAVTAFEVMSRADGLPRMFTPGSLVYANDCDVKGREELFEPVEVAAARTARSVNTETASAAPDERRTRGRAHKGQELKSEETGS
ncbi:hypothetical protein B1T50_04620 [Mycobacterium kansasii]|uniref:Uncharacterized protein n=1 Tax=Mycobacterium ostraviense TaxID=2738409 RepID=A0A164B3Z8_9MYCO|nr:hypothetical protein B1T50_04620 [Mycobacterium kansasii]KZS63092.1 hypothetical protein A4G28_04465 [Mycobacterium ostraviense]